MRLLTSIILLLNASCWLASAQPAVVPLPLSLSLTNPYVWTNAHWWTNASVPTNIYTWQAWWAVNENASRVTNYLSTNTLAHTRIAFTTNTAPANTNAVVWIVFTNGTSTFAIPAAAWP